VIPPALDLTWADAIALPTWGVYVAVITGALVGAEFATRRGFDPIGVFVIAFAQGLGGLMLLDLLLLNGTPQFLSQPLYLIATAVASVTGVFFAGVLNRSRRMLMALDALSMGFLVCVGGEAALELQLPPLSVVFLATLTATGGLVLRDVLAGVAPTLLRPGVLSGVAALAGAAFYTTIERVLDWPEGLEQLLTILLVFALRVLAAWFDWRTTPTAEISDRVWDKVMGSDSEAGQP